MRCDYTVERHPEIDMRGLKATAWASYSYTLLQHSPLRLESLCLLREDPHVALLCYVVHVLCRQRFTRGSREERLEIKVDSRGDYEGS